MNKLEDVIGMILCIFTLISLLFFVLFFQGEGVL